MPAGITVHLSSYLMRSPPCTCARFMPLLRKPVLLLRLSCSSCLPASQAAHSLVVGDALQSPACGREEKAREI